MVSIAALRAALLHDEGFLSRLESLIVDAAVNIRAEAAGTANHAARLAYANLVVGDPRTAARRAKNFILTLTNFAAAGIDIVPAGSGLFYVTTDITDGAAFAQLVSAWDSLSALFTT